MIPCEMTKKYLVFPVNPLSACKQVRFFRGNELIYRLAMNLDMLHPTFYAYVDVQRFRGETLDIACEPEMDFSVTQSDEMELAGLYAEPYRPQLHFSVKNGWNNDPNGLIYLDGTYHLFFQHNPCSTQWGNMQWGHATSTDLLHWTEQDVALFPDELGSMFSGSAILDSENRSGLQQGDQPPVLLFYTAAGADATVPKSHPYTQCMAYSTDGCKTFTKYAGNPLIPCLAEGNRDPKIVWCAPLNAYVMALYLTGDRYALFTSGDLLHWTKHQELALPGDNECPDLILMTAPDGKTKWVLIGAHDRYLVGDFCDGQFTPEQPVQSLSHGGIYYAAQTYSNLGGRVVRFGWDLLFAPFERFSQQLSVPAELTLVCDNGLYRVAAQPVEELEALTFVASKRISVPVTPEEPYERALNCCPVDLTLHFDREPRVYTLTLFGRKFTVDTGENKVSYGKDSAPLWLTDAQPTLRIVSDTCSLEFFADGGRSCFTVTAYQDDNLPYLRIEADKAAVLPSVSCHELSSVWAR